VVNTYLPSLSLLSSLPIAELRDELAGQLAAVACPGVEVKVRDKNPISMTAGN
jgi:hypothetical protein